MERHRFCYFQQWMQFEESVIIRWKGCILLVGSLLYLLTVQIELIYKLTKKLSLKN